jgi:hypothetical protein
MQLRDRQKYVIIFLLKLTVVPGLLLELAHHVKPDLQVLLKLFGVAA